MVTATLKATPPIPTQQKGFYLGSLDYTVTGLKPNTGYTIQLSVADLAEFNTVVETDANGNIDTYANTGYRPPYWSGTHTWVLKVWNNEHNIVGRGVLEVQATAVVTLP